MGLHAAVTDDLTVGAALELGTVEAVKNHVRLILFNAISGSEKTAAVTFECKDFQKLLLPLVGTELLHAAGRATTCISHSRGRCRSQYDA